MEEEEEVEEEEQEEEGGGGGGGRRREIGTEWGVGGGRGEGYSLISKLCQTRPTPSTRLLFN